MYRVLRGDYGLHNRPTAQVIGKIVKEFEDTGVVTNHHRFAHFAENIAIVSRMYRFLVILRNKGCLKAHFGVFCI